MVKTKGSIDKKRRRGRSDKGKIRKIYRGKQTKPKRKKSGNFVPYIPPFEKKIYLKIRFQEVLPMSKEGFERLTPQAKRKFRKTVYYWKHRIDPRIDEINTKEKLIHYLEKDAGLWAGTFYIHGYSHGKTRTHIKSKTRWIVKLLDREDGLKVVHLEKTRFNRYPWYKG